MATWRLAIGSRSTDAVTIDAALADGPGFGKLVFAAALPASVQIGEIINDVSGNDHLIVSIENTREVARAFELDGVAAGSGGATIGRAYSDLISAEAAMENFVAGGDIVRCEMYNDLTFTTGVDLSSAALVLGVFVVTAVQGERHTGKAGTGVVIDPAAAGNVLERSGNTLALVVEWIEVTGWSSNGGDAAAVFCAGTANPNQEDMVRHCIIHDDAGGASAENGVVGSANQAILAYGNLLYDISGTAIHANYAAPFVPVFFDAVVGNTIQGCGVGIKNSAVAATRPVLVTNNAVFDCTTAFEITGTSVWHNLSGGNASNSDLSALPGVNNGNLTTADELVDTAADDFEARYRGTLPGGGIDPAPLALGETFAVIVQLGESWSTASALDLAGNVSSVFDAGAYSHRTVRVAVGSRAPTSLVLLASSDVPNQTGPEHTVTVDSAAGILVGEMLSDNASIDFLILSISGTTLALRAVGHTLAPALGTASVERAYSDMQTAETDAVNYLRKGEVWQLELYNDLTYTDSVSFNTTAAKGGRLVVTVPGGERHDGVPGAGVLIDVSFSLGSVVRLDVIYDSLVEWLEITNWFTLSLAQNAGIEDSGAVGTEGIVQRCIIHDNQGFDGDPAGIWSKTGSRGLKVRNCLIYGLTLSAAGVLRGIRVDSSGTTLDNCTIVLSKGRGIESTVTGTIVRNNLVFGADEAFRASGKFSEGSSGNNLTDGSFAPGATSRTGVVAAKVFLAPSRDNYTLRARSPALEAGQDLSADFTDDLAGLVRVPPWDVGSLHVPFPAVLGYEAIRHINVTKVTALGKLSAAAMPAPILHWYIDGQHMQSQRGPSHTLLNAAAEAAQVEAVATTDPLFDPFADPPVGWPGRRSLWWTRSIQDELSLYRIEQRRDGGAWVVIARVHHRKHRWVYWVWTPVLTDLSLYEWRGIPIDRAGNDGTAFALGSHKVARNPAAPEFTLSFNSGDSKVTIAEVT